MRCVIAPDKFKGSLAADQVAAHLAAGIRSVDPYAEINIIAVADGGEGTLEAAIGAGFRRHTATVTGPTGQPIEAAFGVRGSDAVIELALASGLAVLPGGVRDPCGAGSRGTGELIRAALDLGCKRITLGVGGSASTDGGAGLLQALGVRLLDRDGLELPGGGGALTRLERIDLSYLDSRVADTEFILASDVDNPLLGPTGAATVFGPQKGASPRDVQLLDSAVTTFVRVLETELGPIARSSATAHGAGAAGGCGFAALAVLSAVRRSGIEVVLELTRFTEQLVDTDLVITGEGSLDGQSLFGKTPIGVARAAAAHGIAVYAVCGRTTLSPTQLTTAGFEHTFALTDIEANVETCLREAGALLERTGRRIARRFYSKARFDLVLRAAQILTDSGIISGEVGVRDGTIVAVLPHQNELTATSVIVLRDDEVLLPGLVDTHGQVNGPGRTAGNGFASATHAAAAGGVTTIIDRPLNSMPPTISVAALELKRSVAEHQIFVDVGFWGAAVSGNLDDLRPLHDAGVFGFTSFAVESGVEEFPAVSSRRLHEQLVELAGFDARMLVSAENTAIAVVIARARQTGARVHIPQLSCASALDLIAAARRDGVAITVGTCPHSLTLVAEQSPDGATAVTGYPPIQEGANRDRLWQGLLDGTIDCIESGPSPRTHDPKQPPGADFAGAWDGNSSLQLGLPLVWTEAARRGIPLETVLRWMSGVPAQLAGLNRKGRISPGADADFAVFAPTEQFVVDATGLERAHPVTADDGQLLCGRVRATFLRGVAIDGSRPTGKLIRRETA